tara:strand:+ start:261 stop:518 length:258 start_codon:yes stop_codon:yes gene_type:complete
MLVASSLPECADMQLPSILATYPSHISTATEFGPGKTSKKQSEEAKSSLNPHEYRQHRAKEHHILLGSMKTNLVASDLHRHGLFL